jgi:hypothetical protein
MITLQTFKALGIYEGNCVTKDTVHNGGWYDIRGVKVGWGDLSPKNIEALRTAIGADDVLFVLSEQDSYWKFVTDIKGPAYLGYVTTDDGEKHPGIDYVMQHARLVVHNHEVWSVRADYEDQEKEETDVDLRNGVTARDISRDTLRSRLAHVVQVS